MIRFGTRYSARPTYPWRGALAGAAVLGALSLAAAYPAKADDVQRSGTGANYVQYEHDARVHSMQLMESRAADAEAQTDRAIAAEQDRSLHAAGADQSGALQAQGLAAPNASTNQ